jgi:hypothetical protein
MDYMQLPDTLVSNSCAYPDFDHCVNTQVDAKHVSRHLDEAESDASRVSEAVEQVAMADVILLNKTDLVRVCVGEGGVGGVGKGGRGGGGWRTGEPVGGWGSRCGWVGGEGQGG